MTALFVLCLLAQISENPDRLIGQAELVVVDPFGKTRSYKVIRLVPRGDRKNLSSHMKGNQTPSLLAGVYDVDFEPVDRSSRWRLSRTEECKDASFSASFTLEARVNVLHLFERTEECFTITDIRIVPLKLVFRARQPLRGILRIVRATSGRAESCRIVSNACTISSLEPGSYVVAIYADGRLSATGAFDLPDGGWPATEATVDVRPR